MSRKSKYFLKDKKAMIYQSTQTRTSIGDYTEYWTPVAPSLLWCYTKQVSEDLRLRAMAVNTDETRLFVFNYRSSVKPGNLVKYKDVWYEVTRVDTDDDYNTDMYVYVKNLLFTPSDVREYPVS